MIEKEPKQKFAEKHPKAADALFTTAVLSSILTMGIGASAAADATKDWDPFGNDDEIQQAVRDSFVEHVRVATNEAYSGRDIVVEFTLDETDLDTATFEKMHETLGDEVYMNLPPRANDVLHTSVEVQLEQREPKPGDTFVIVEKDIDPKGLNGTEYVVVTPPQINYED